MALFVSNTFPPPPNLAPYAIGREWCIGDTVGIFNTNFTYFDTLTLQTSSNLASLSAHVYRFNVLDTPTINLTHILNTNQLSAEVIDGSINTTKLGGNILQSGKALLTSVSLTALQDVTIVNNISGGQVLAWNATNKRWQNTTLNLGGGGGGGGPTLIPGTDYGDIVIDLDGSWRLDQTPGQEAVTTNAIRNNAVTRDKLTSGAPYWTSTGNFGIGNTLPQSRLTVGGDFLTGFSETASINAGQLGSAENTVLNVATIGFRSGQPTVAFSVKGKRVTTGLTTDTVALGIGLDVDNNSPASIWFREGGRVGILTDRPTQTLTVQGTISASGTIFSNNFTGNATTASNILRTTGTPANQLLYQLDANTTELIAAGTATQVLRSNGSAAAPSWTNQSDLSAGRANTITLGAAGQILYQSAPNVTAFLPAGLATQVLIGGTTPSWSNISTLGVDLATRANRLDAVGVANEYRLVYQFGTNTTATIAQGAAGQVLVGQANNIPTWVNPADATNGIIARSANAVANNSISDQSLRDSGALSVIGRSQNSIGDPGDIAASADGQVLRRAGGLLGFGTITSAGIGVGAVEEGNIAGGAVSSSKLAATAISGQTSKTSLENDDEFIINDPGVGLRKVAGSTLIGQLLPSGSPIRVASGVYTAIRDLGSAGANVWIDILSVTLNRLYANSNVLVQGMGTAGTYSAAYPCMVRVVRGGSVIMEGDQNSADPLSIRGQAVVPFLNADVPGTAYIQFVDTTASSISTNSLTYTLQMRITSATYDAFVNQGRNPGNNAGSITGITTLTVTEIKA